MATALVTGASSGIGKEFCHQLATRGHDLVLVSRNRDRLEELATELHNYYGVKARVLPADLSQYDQVKQVAQCLLSQEEPISLLVNNAGFAPAQSFVDGVLDREVEGLNVMVRAVMLLSYAAAKAMRERGVGAILNVSSIVSGLPMGTYAAHKSWVEQFTYSLRGELAGTGVQVMALKPGTTRTHFFDPVGLKLGRAGRGLVLDPAYVAERALDDLARGRSESVPGLLYQVLEVAKYKAPLTLTRKITHWVHHNRMRV